MTHKAYDQPDSDEPRVYEIRIKGKLDPAWAVWFEEMTITTTETGETVLLGPVMDQAALYGLLRKIRDLGLPLMAVTQIQGKQ